ncbi:hypothetical protein B0H13DRAFT_1857121 [Mycena leptocephala]|nr:hypothetical protein B0H13DRAFT_1857121 [Mycena leptocephala]
MLGPRLRSYYAQTSIFDGCCDVCDRAEGDLAEDTTREQGSDGHSDGDARQKHDSCKSIDLSDLERDVSLIADMSLPFDLMGPNIGSRHAPPTAVFRPLPPRPAIHAQHEPKTGRTETPWACDANGKEALSTPSRIPISRRMLSLRLHARCECRKPVAFEGCCDVLNFDSAKEQPTDNRRGDDCDGDADSDSFSPGLQDVEGQQQHNSYNSIDLSQVSLIVDMTIPLDLMDPGSPHKNRVLRSHHAPPCLRNMTDCAATPSPKSDRLHARVGATLTATRRNGQG